MPSHYLIKMPQVDINELSDSERNCPICQEPYEGDLQAHAPVHVTGEDQNQQCKHVFGFTCVLQHIHGGEPWSLRCPICRESWVRPPIPEGDEMASLHDDLAALQRQLADRANDESQNQSPSSDPVWFEVMNAPPAVPYHDAPEVVAGPQIVQRNSTPDPQSLESTLFNRGRFHRSLGFLRQMPAEFEIDDWDGDVMQWVSELETAGERLWAALEEAREWNIR